MSMFQKMVDNLIKKELEHAKELKLKKEEEEAKVIHNKETTQSKINALLEKEKEKEKEKRLEN